MVNGIAEKAQLSQLPLHGNNMLESYEMQKQFLLVQHPQNWKHINSPKENKKVI